MATIDRDGVHIYYETHGDAGEPVLLLMGLGTDAHGWEFQVPVLAARHRVILVDNRGIGRSGKPPGPYTTALLAADALAVLDAVNVARAHVVGLSMGGMIAQEIALAAPARVGALVLAATYARPGHEVGRTINEGALGIAGMPSPDAILGGQPIDLSKVDVGQIFRFLMPLIFSPRFLSEQQQYLAEFFMRSMAYGFTVEGLVGQIAATMAHDAAARLPSLALPTMVMTGTADRLVPPHHSDELASLIPGARLVRLEGEGATHGLNWEKAEEFNRALLDFLGEHPL